MEVTFSEVVGMEELNDGRPRKVKNCKVSHFKTCVRLYQYILMSLGSKKPVLAAEPPSTLAQHVSPLRML